MSTGATSLLLSAEDRARVVLVDGLVRSGAAGVGGLLDLLVNPSWVVRRAVVAALASLGDVAVEGLEDILLNHRTQEGRLAASVDALVATRADVDGRMMKLASGTHRPAVICDAVQVLGRRGAHAAIPLLRSLSSDTDDNVAVAAIEALGRIGGTETVDALVAAVEGRRFFRTFPAIHTLARTGDPRAVPALASLLGDPLYAPDAARALAQTGHESATAPLASLLSVPNLALVRAAAMALADLRERYEAKFGNNDVIRSALPNAVPSAVASARIIESLEGATPSDFVPIARVLAWFGDDHAVSRFIERMLHDAPIGKAATDALQRLGPAATKHLLAAIRDGDSARRLALLPIVGPASASIDELLLCLVDAEPDVRVLAAQTLARLGNPAAAPALFRLICDGDGRVSQAAVAAIQSLGSDETKRLALEQARATDVRVRRAAVRIISYFGYSEGLGILVEAMADQDEKVREAAIYGIPLLDDPKGIETLLATATATATASRTRAAIMRALGQTAKTPAVATALSAALSDADPWVRYYACQSLGRLRVEEACPQVVALMHDPAGQVRLAAVEALAHLADDCATNALAEATRSDDADMRRAAFLGLGMARRPESIAILREAAGAADAATRLVALAALSELEGPDVVPALAHAASDSDASVRTAAIGYLSRRPAADARSALVGQIIAPRPRSHGTSSFAASPAGEAAPELDPVLEALAFEPDARVDGVLEKLASADARTAPLYVAALTRMLRPNSAAALASALALDNVHARRAAASALAASGSPEGRRALDRAAADDSDPDVQRICAAAART